jgi:methionyl-tRNA formyltransferase
MKIGFFGTPELSAAVLRDCLAADDVEVAYAVSQPDRPVGRHADMTASPVSRLAMESGLPLYRPEKIRNNPEFLAELQKFEVDYLVVVAYGRILPVEILALPKRLPVNVHGSLLPKYRGASPIQSALLEGEKETGVTIMEMTAGMDEGGILEMTAIAIDPEETSDTLFAKFAKISGNSLLSALRKHADHRISIVEQDHSLATYTKKFEKDNGRILWAEMTATEVYRRWQACTTWPGAWTVLDGKRIKICGCTVVASDPSALTPGSFRTTAGGRIHVVTKEGTIELGDVIVE